MLIEIMGLKPKSVVVEHAPVRTDMSRQRYQDNHLASHALCGESLWMILESASAAFFALIH